MAIKTIGLRTSLWNNNAKTIFLLSLFPMILMGVAWGIVYFLVDGNMSNVLYPTLILGGLFNSVALLWLLVLYVGSHEHLTMKFVGAQKANRAKHSEVYNLLENLSIAAGIKMPSLYIIESSALNAFASGLKVNESCIAVTSGLLKKLTKDELEGVLAHELSHILHRDTRVMTLAVVFTGVIAIIAEGIFRGMRHTRSSKSSNGKGSGVAILAIFGIAAIGYLISIFSKAAISRKREYMADAGAIKLTKNKSAMVDALNKISKKSKIKEFKSDFKYMLFENQEAYCGLLNTHPPIEDRIKAIKSY